jgi:hypothetical protein
MAPINLPPESIPGTETIRLPTEDEFVSGILDTSFEVETESLALISLPECPVKAAVLSPIDGKWYVHVTDQAQVWEFNNKSRARVKAYIELALWKHRLPEKVKTA